MPVLLAPVATKLLIIVPGVNAAILSITLYALDVAFWKSVFVALVSAIVSGVFLLASTIIVTREARTNREAIGEVRNEQREVKSKLENRTRERHPGDRRQEHRRTEDK